MNAMIEKLNSALGPAATSTLGKALIGVAILIIGMMVVRFISGMINKLLDQSDFLVKNKLAGPIGSLIKAVLTVFVLMAVLQHFGLSEVLVPLQTMNEQILQTVPKIIGAGVVGYIGWVLAKIISELVGVALGKVDEQISLRTGNDELKISRFGSAFVFAAILLPITTGALGILDIPTITEPATAMIDDLIGAVPKIVGAGVILLVAYFAAKFVIYVLSGLLDGMGINSLPEKLGVTGMFNDSFTPTRLVGGAIMFFAMLTASTAAVHTLEIDVISAIFAKVLEFGGGLLIGGVILVVGNFLGNLAYQKLLSGTNPGLANIARIAILGLVLAMGLRSMGLADNIVNMAFGFTIGAVAIAAALAFGLGGRDAAKSVADSWADRVTKK